MKRRNNCSGKYYIIYNPLPVNEYTGNFCVNDKDVLAQDKDFLFELENPVTHEIESKVISKEYVKNHIKPIPKWVEDEILGKKKIVHMFFIISYQDIINY